MRRQIITTAADLDRIDSAILASARAAVRDLEAILRADSPLETFAVLKFSESGRDPLDPERTLNLVEQLNQSFTYLASTAAARWLLSRHPECAPLTLNLGTASGPDIQSADGQFVAETFAVTRPGSNDKLRKDIAKVRTSSAAHRFVFYLSPVAAKPPIGDGVTVVRLEHPAMTVIRSVRKDA